MKPKKIEAGDVFQLNGGGSCTVVEYISWDKVRIRHDDAHALEVVVQSSHLRRGEIKNPYHPSVYGVGFIGAGEHAASESRMLTREYKIWIGMLQRSYDDKLHARHPSYIGVSVCAEWHNFQTFAEWMKSQPNAYLKGFEIDKDIIVRGNKVYSPDTCSFVPCQINTIINDCGARRGNLPVGVVYRKRDKKYYAQMNIDGVMKHISSHETPDEAFSAYKEKREERIRLLANQHKGNISEAVYRSLVNWEIAPYT